MSVTEKGGLERAGSKNTRKFKARLIKTKESFVDKDVMVVTIPSFYVKTDVIQKPRVLNVPVMRGKELNIPVGGLSTSYFVYKIEIRMGNGNAWRLERTYNEFRELHAKIKTRFPSMGKIITRFPRKNLLSLNPNSVYAEYRRKFFQGYLQALLQLKPRFHFVNDFLEVHNHAEKKPKKDLSIEDFELVKVLGKGSFGKVFLVRIIGSQDIYAMKVLQKKEVKERRQIEHTKTELRVMGATSHPFIVTLRFAFKDETRLFMVSDFCQGGELFYHLKSQGKFTPKMVQFYTAEIALALHYLHTNQVVYRDLKPENILLDRQGHVKVADFGLSRDNMTDPDEGAKTLCGTPEYLAPEMLTGRKTNKGYGFAVDWWALGILMYEMFVSLPPFYDTNKKNMMRKILRGKLVTKGKGIPDEAEDVIFGFLDREPQNRMGVRKGFDEIANHPFFTEFEGGLIFTDLLAKKIDPPYLSSLQGNGTANFENEFTDQVAKLSEDDGSNNGERPMKLDSSELFDEEDEFADFTFSREPMDNEFFNPSN